MQVTKNEKFLLSILIAIAFFGGNYMGYRWLTQKQTSLDSSLAQLKGDQAETQVNLLESDKWAQRKTWLDSKQPPMTDEGDAKAQVLESVLKGARDNKLEIQDQALNDVEHGAAGTRVNVSVKVKGSTEAAMKWLTAYEKPDQFYAISSFALWADQDQKSMICQVQIARYFKSP